MKETDLFLPVKELLLDKGCKNVYGEVCNYDVVGISDHEEYIVEMKKGMNFKVIEQAHAGIGRAKYVYVAIPKPKNEAPNRFARKILNDYGLGLIYVENDAAYIEIESAEHEIQWGNIRKDTKPYNNLTIGGVKSGDGPTQYSLLIDNVKRYLGGVGWASIDDILKHVETHYKNPKLSLAATLKASWNEEWCDFKVIGRKTQFKLKSHEIN